MAATRRRTTEYMLLSDVKRAVVNPKLHDQDGIRGSIADQGFVEIPTIDERTGHLVAGHGRLTALEEMHYAGQDPPPDVEVNADGEWLLPVSRGWASRDDKHAAAYLVASNKLTSNGGWNDDQLAAILSDLNADDMLQLTGFTDDELGNLLRVDDDDDGPGAGGDPDSDDGIPVYGVVVFCNGEAAQDALLYRLQEQRYNAKTIAAAGIKFVRAD